ncbi:hypothetical protein PsorP6_001745 [Peronosclerospora sorghi]|uniref:Uncharacterized protein n=1 Tax=Peronosclerospora sorghi TaxID=230839 RepID=A0ACC0WY16_9STRA|nr:hypothetical protein PsorP6_001745 [Peronosclerospora sorghi]
MGGYLDSAANIASWKDFENVIVKVLNQKGDSLSESEIHANRLINVKWISPTSNRVERFFSQVKAAMGYLRKNFKQETLEGLMFVKMN